jgi:integrase
VAKAVGLERSRPYDLRHSFVSLLIHEGRTVLEVAAQTGHAPTMTLSTYAHVIAELEGAERVPRGDADPLRTPRIRTRFVPAARSRDEARTRNPCKRPSPLSDSNR